MGVYGREVYSMSMHTGQKYTWVYMGRGGPIEWGEPQD